MILLLLFAPNNKMQVYINEELIDVENDRKFHPQRWNKKAYRGDYQQFLVCTDDGLLVAWNMRTFIAIKNGARVLDEFLKKQWVKLAEKYGVIPRQKLFDYLTKHAKYNVLTLISDLQETSYTKEKANELLATKEWMSHWTLVSTASGHYLIYYEQSDLDMDRVSYYITEMGIVPK